MEEIYAGWSIIMFTTLWGLVSALVANLKS